MRVDLTFFVNQLNKPSEAFLNQLIVELSRNSKIEVIYLKGPHQDMDGVRVRRVASWYSFRFLLCLPLMLVALGKVNLRSAYRLFILRSAKADKIYFPFVSMINEFNTVLAYCKKKIYSSIRGTDITVTPYIRSKVIDVYKKISYEVEAIHFLSEELQDRTHQLGISFKQEKVIYQGLDLNKFKFNDHPPMDKLRMISVGRLHYIKGLEYLLLICFLLKKRDVDFQLTIVGSGSDQEKIKYLIYYFDLQDLVSIVNHVGHNELSDVYHKHNIYIHTHLVTGVSNTMLEALSSNLRVITFDSNVSSYKQGLISHFISEVPKGDLVGFCDLLVQWSKTKAYGADKIAVNQALQPFYFENHVKEFKEFFTLN